MRILALVALACVFVVFSLPFVKAYSVADVNQDGKVDIKDLAALAVHFGTYAGGPGYDSTFDLNSDGKIDIQDLAIVAMNFGT